MPYTHAGDSQKQILYTSPYLALGGLSLAGVAGYINAVALSFFHIPVSHMSGAVTHLSTDALVADWSAFGFSLSIVAGFLAGAILSGLLIGGSLFRPGRRYGVALALEGGILLLAALVIDSGRSWGPPLAALACGLQNGMASSYYGLIVRTTHVTGILTDIGVLLGQFLRHRELEFWKLIILSAIFLGFFGGAVLGAFLARDLGARALLVPGFGCPLVGALYAWLVWPRSTGGK